MGGGLADPSAAWNHRMAQDRHSPPAAAPPPPPPPAPESRPRPAHQEVVLELAGGLGGRWGGRSGPQIRASHQTQPTGGWILRPSLAHERAAGLLCGRPMGPGLCQNHWGRGWRED